MPRSCARFVVCGSVPAGRGKPLPYKGLRDARVANTTAQRTGLRRLVLEEFLDCGGQAFGLGEDGVFELGLVGAEGVHGGYAGHRGV